MYIDIYKYILYTYTGGGAVGKKKKKKQRLRAHDTKSGAND